MIDSEIREEGRLINQERDNRPVRFILISIEVTRSRLPFSLSPVTWETGEELVLNQHPMN
jgi:hypothetical protein